jgi:hypothetical protein
MFQIMDLGEAGASNAIGLLMNCRLRPTRLPPVVASYLKSMIVGRARAATVRVMPRG